MINPELLDGSSEEGVNNTIKQTMSSNNNNDKNKDKNKNSKNKTRPIFIVKQRTKLSKYWTPVSHYNETGNFLGAAVFDTKAEAQKYLKIYEQKNITRIQKFVEKKQDNP